MTDDRPQSAPYLVAITVWLIAAAPWLYTSLRDDVRALKQAAPALWAYLRGAT